jgi:hypothetical protein
MPPLELVISLALEKKKNGFNSHSDMLTYVHTYTFTCVHVTMHVRTCLHANLH